VNKWLHSALVALLSLGLALPAHGGIKVPFKPKPKQKEVKVNLGMFEGQSDVGNVHPAGTTQFDGGPKTYTLTGAGDNMWLGKDSFHFLWKKVSGDVSLTADISFPSPGGNAHRKAAVLIRQSLDADSLYADAALHGSGLTALQFRPETGVTTQDKELNFASITDAPNRLRIEKRGDLITMYMSAHGEPLHPSGASIRLHLEGSFYVGLGVCSHDPNVVEKAVFGNVDFHTLAEGAPPPAKTDLYSTLETISIDAESRRATLIETVKGHFEAPNWSRDGNTLLFDQDGRIMTVSSDGKLPATPHALDIGLATKCNGSHGLSPDGKLLAISCNMPDAPGSRVYVLPSNGGTPHIVTANPSSYFHSWSPDGKTIAFTRPHQGGGDIYSIPVEGGDEMALTATVGISDDPDYSPDGQYIYFNSDRGGGSMQIWRMHADGSGPEQVTSDEMNNWTPHISPDGKWMVFLSYDKGVTGHPANKEIALRLMSLADKKITTLATLLGGSGTMNVPSWAPDSHSLAFVSYELVGDEPPPPPAQAPKSK
jgi:TolB protein